MECIVLAGGLGTRLSGVIGAKPKCMAMVAGKPFIAHLFRYLSEQKCGHVILSLGFRHEEVLDWLGATSWPFEVSYVIEQEPLGTGGGISLALSQAKEDQVIVINGDTMFPIDLDSLLRFHTQQEATVTIALKEMHDFDRYGTVKTTGGAGLVLAFEEKQYKEQGTINGGIYVIRKAKLLEKQLPEKYSFEKDFLEAYTAEQHFYGWVSTAYFIDIGVPEDYARAQTELSN
jgi:D-glycero-alpha-D-manno-heptose 1-phosphate guanylyltransferase